MKMNLKNKISFPELNWISKMKNESVPFGSCLMFWSPFSQLDLHGINISEAFNLDERNYRLIQQYGECVGEPKLVHLMKKEDFIVDSMKEKDEKINKDEESTLIQY